MSSRMCKTPVNFGNGAMIFLGRAVGAFQQQLPFFDPSLQSQDGSLPVIMPLMIAAAHPTPLSTRIAPNAQLVMQAPHSIHLSLSTMTAVLSFIDKTPWGQTSMHVPQPMHLS